MFDTAIERAAPAKPRRSRAASPAGAVRGDPPGQRNAGRQSVAGGSGDPVDARCQPDKMASGAYELVFRDLCPRAARSGLSRLRPGLRLSVQFVLRGGRPAPSAAAARSAVAPDGRCDRRLSRSCHGCGAALGRRGRRCGVARGRAADRTRAASRAAASGIDADGHQARVLGQPAASRLSGAASLRRSPPVRAAPGWVEFAGGLCEIGHDGSGFAFDNEGPRHKVWLEPLPPGRRIR